jgi:predicted house-cleaning noncanonical NTP pyrophosphatase (MazG superfamily)
MNSQKQPKIRRFSCNKLVRDNVPARIASKGGMLAYHTLKNDTEYRAALYRKLCEEVHELKSAHTDEERALEIADVLEVVHAIARLQNLSSADVDRVRQEKNGVMGAFEHRIFSETVAFSDDNPNIEYYTSRPGHYPEIESTP